MVTRVGDLLVDHPEVVELDLHPLITAGDQAVAVDALIIVDRTQKGEAEHTGTEGIPCERTSRT